MLHRIGAPRSAVYRALLNAQLVQRWMAPPDLQVTVHRFEPTDGGVFALELADPADPELRGSVVGRFSRLVPDTAVVQIVRFGAGDPADLDDDDPDDDPDDLGAEMTIVFALKDVDGGTELVCTQHPLPNGVDEHENAAGWRRSIERLAALVEPAAPATAQDVGP